MTQMSKRTEHDSLGEVEVPADALWGAQTQRSLENFAIGRDRFPPAFIHAFALVKKAAALSNYELKKIDQHRCHLIGEVCDEILRGDHDDQFPLSVWQTGSGTQTNMNLNEVIANRANELAGGERGVYDPLHPNDHVNMSQSSNDVFPTAMHVVVAQVMKQNFFPALVELLDMLHDQSEAFGGRVKSGRTHMMDATPVTLGQEFSGYYHQTLFAYHQLKAIMPNVRQLALGGSAVGTGLNTHPDWAASVARQISALSGIQFEPADNHFMALSAHDVLVDLHGRLNTLATALFKIGNDLRLMNSGPRCGLAEIQLPANEPGSSIMPGKVNPTQVEALTMVCSKVMGNHTSVSVGGSQGHFQLNVFKPLLIHQLLDSITLLGDSMRSFTRRCLKGITVNDEQLNHYVERSLMLVTALSPVIGYENAARVAKHANDRNISLRESALELDMISAEDFDRHVDPSAMLGP